MVPTSVLLFLRFESHRLEEAAYLTQKTALPSFLWALWFNTKFPQHSELLMNRKKLKLIRYNELHIQAPLFFCSAIRISSVWRDITANSKTALPSSSWLFDSTAWHTVCWNIKYNKKKSVPSKNCEFKLTLLKQQQMYTKRLYLTENYLCIKR